MTHSLMISWRSPANIEAVVVDLGTALEEYYYGSNASNNRLLDKIRCQTM
jgi:hypothetical protein